MGVLCPPKSIGGRAEPPARSRWRPNSSTWRPGRARPRRGPRPGGVCALRGTRFGWETAPGAVLQGRGELAARSPHHALSAPWPWDQLCSQAGGDTADHGTHTCSCWPRGSPGDCCEHQGSGVTGVRHQAITSTWLPQVQLLLTPSSSTSSPCSQSWPTQLQSSSWSCSVGQHHTRSWH